MTFSFNSQLTIPFHFQRKYHIAVSFFIKMDVPNIIAYATLPTERQEVILLQVFSRKGTNHMTILQAAARDMDFVMGQIAHHQREVAAGTPLDVAAAVRVLPVAHRFAPNHANSVDPNRHRNVRPQHVNFNPGNAYDPNADADDESEAKIDVGFELTNPTAYL